MNHDYEDTEFSKSVLAGVFAGITAILLSLIYNTIFRRITGFSLSEIINVSTVIFALLIAVIVAGLIFYLFHHYLKRGTIIFQAAAFILTVLLVVGSMQVQRSSDPLLTNEFQGLLLGIVAITGACTVFLIPFLYKRNIV